MNNHRLAVILGITLGVSFAVSACSQEEYGPCSIPDTSAHRAACSPVGESKTATCAADYVFDCDSMICGRYDSSDSFCTHRCKPKPENCNDKNFCDCPAGKDCVDECPEGAACVEWISGTGAYFCLPQDKGCKSGYSYNSSDPCYAKVNTGTPASTSGTGTGNGTAESGEEGK